MLSLTLGTRGSELALAQSPLGALGTPRPFRSAVPEGACPNAGGTPGNEHSWSAGGSVELLKAAA